MGQFYYFCKKNGYLNYTGIDASTENIEYIKNIFDENPEVFVEDIISYLSSQKAREEKYDVVVLNDVIEHLSKSEIFDVLDGVHRILNDEGVFFIKTPNMANPFVSTAGRYIDFTHEIGFTEKSMRQVLRASCYRDIKIIGTDVYVMIPVINIISKIFSKIVNIALFLFSALYGRTSLRIFEKDILAVARK